eukprot:c9304_g1_i2.p1 GENE.c9304_g1_i2~~c9304_g1_i2.p1  ORF type:complete len:259 (-),score=41.25 c9304_g1_i2:103-879(-)
MTLHFGCLMPRLSLPSHSLAARHPSMSADQFLPRFRAPQPVPRRRTTAPTITPASSNWEWRVFSPRKLPIPSKLAKSLKAADRTDEYLLCHEALGLKARGGAKIELKARLKRRADGEYWVKYDVRTPKSRAARKVAEVMADVAAAHPEIKAPVADLGQSEETIASVHVTKSRRVRSLGGGCKIERTKLTLPGGTKWWSLAAEGPTRESLRPLIAMLQDECGVGSLEHEGYPAWAERVAAAATTVTTTASATSDHSSNS